MKVSPDMPRQEMGAQSYSDSVPPSTSPTSSTVDPVSLSNFLQRQVRKIVNRLVRLQQGLLICRFLSVLVAGSLIALVSFVYFFVYFQSGNASQLLGMHVVAGHRSC